MRDTNVTEGDLIRSQKLKNSVYIQSRINILDHCRFPKAKQCFLATLFALDEHVQHALPLRKFFIRMETCSMQFCQRKKLLVAPSML